MPSMCGIILMIFFHKPEGRASVTSPAPTK